LTNSLIAGSTGDGLNENSPAMREISMEVEIDLGADSITEDVAPDARSTSTSMAWWVRFTPDATL
jgi:hypothetical protein